MKRDKNAYCIHTTQWRLKRGEGGRPPRKNLRAQLEGGHLLDPLLRFFLMIQLIQLDSF